jgi:hypothetical protein
VERKIIKDLMRGETKRNQNDQKNPLYSNLSFNQLFSKKIARKLSVTSLDSIILMLILIVAFCAIGFAKGSLIYLSDKMKDPFVNWIDVDVPSYKTNKLPTFIKRLSSNINKRTYFIDSVTGYYSYSLFIRNPSDRDDYICYGRSIDVTDSILKKIGNKKNLIKGKVFHDSKDIGLIVTEKFFKKYGHHKNALFINMSYSTEIDQRVIPVPIIGVVKNLPEQSTFISTNYYYEQLFDDKTNPFSPTHTKALTIFIACDKKKAFEFKKLVQEYFIKSKVDAFILKPKLFNQSYKEGYTVYIDIEPKPDLKKLDKIFEELNNYLKKMNFSNIIQLYQHPFTNRKTEKKYHRLSIHMDELKSISQFQSFLDKKPFELYVDMSKIDSLRTYNFVSNLTLILSLMMISISITSICIFIGYILFIHLYKMRVYIGSLMAFGVTNTILKSIYFTSFIMFVIKSIVISYLFSLCLGYSRFVQNCLGLEKGYAFFDLFNIYIVFFVIIVCISGIVTLWLTTNNIFKHTPGDLIYDRI